MRGEEPEGGRGDLHGVLQDGCAASQVLGWVWHLCPLRPSALGTRGALKIQSPQLPPSLPDHGHIWKFNRKVEFPNTKQKTPAHAPPALTLPAVLGMPWPQIRGRLSLPGPEPPAQHDSGQGSQPLPLGRPASP